MQTIYENDIVPRLNIHNIARLKAIVETIDAYRSSIFQMILMVTGAKNPDEKYIKIGLISLLKHFLYSMQIMTSVSAGNLEKSTEN